MTTCRARFWCVIFATLICDLVISSRKSSRLSTDTNGITRRSPGCGNLRSSSNRETTGVGATLRQRDQGVGFGLRQIYRHLFRTAEASNLQQRGWRGGRPGRKCAFVAAFGLDTREILAGEAEVVAGMGTVDRCLSYGGLSCGGGGVLHGIEAGFEGWGEELGFDESATAETQAAWRIPRRGCAPWLWLGGGYGRIAQRDLCIVQPQNATRHGLKPPTAAYDLHCETASGPVVSGRRRDLGRRKELHWFVRTISSAARRAAYSRLAPMCSGVS